jgi:hypothetical protein
MGGSMSAMPASTDFIRENPFETYRDELEQHRTDSHFLGHTMFWKHSDQIPVKHIYHTDNIEYRNMKLMFLEMLFYFLHLFALTTFVTNTASSVEYETREQQLAFWQICAKPVDMGVPACSLRDNTAAGFYGYLKDVFVPTIFNGIESYPEMFDQDFLYDLDEKSVEWAPRYLGDTNTTVLLGLVKMRQLRVVPNQGCTLPLNMTEIHPRCYGPFFSEYQSYMMYAKKKTPRSIMPCYKWRPQNETEMQEMIGSFGEYPGEGYMFEFPLVQSEALDMITLLEEWQWVDVQTRAIILEVSTFNPNVNIIATNRILFEFGPTGELKPVHDVFVLPTQYLTLSTTGSGSTLFLWQVACTVGFVFLTIYHAVLISKDPFTFWTYTWNLADVTNLILFYAYVYYRYQILTIFSQDNNLQQELAGMPLVYMPYINLQTPFQRGQAILAWLCLFSWMRLLKYLSLSKTFRVLIRTLEACCFQLFIFSFLYLSVTIGFTIAFVVGFGAADTTDGLYATFSGCFFTLFFMLVGGADLEPILGRGTVSYMHNWYLRYALFVMYMILISLLFFNFFMAIVIDTYTRVSIQLADFNMDGASKKNPCMVFLYTYFYKWKGVQLVKEDEENIGQPDEQYIETDLLPGFLAQAWKGKQVALIEMIATAEKQAQDERNASGGQGIGGRLRRSLGGADGSKRGSKALPALNDKLISRLQLQRLLDDDPALREVLGATRAVDVIRRFRADRGPDPYQEITRLQESVILKLDSLEKVGLNLEFAEVDTLKMVSNGLNDALTEVQNQWRTELTTLLESCSTISNHLIDLTQKLAQCTDKHNEIARDIQVEDQ